MDRAHYETSVADDDEMSSYGLHPAVHEELVRCHNPALEPPLAQVHKRISRLVRESAPTGEAPGLKLSA